MLRIKIEHKYCGTIRTIEGKNLVSAFRINNINSRYWTVLEIEEIN